MSALETVGSIIVTLFLASMAGLAGLGLARKLLTGTSASTRKTAGMVVGAVVALVGVIWLFGDRTDRFIGSSEAGKIAVTVWVVLLSVLTSATLFVSLNILFNQSSKNYQRFSTLLGAIIGFITFGLLDGNRLIQHINGRDTLADGLHDIVNANSWTLLFFSIILASGITAAAAAAAGFTRDAAQQWAAVGAIVGVVMGFLWGVFFAERIPVDTTVSLLWTPLLGAVLVGALGYALSILDQPVRLAVGTLGGAAIGALIGGFLFQISSPRLQVLPMILWPVVLAVLGGGFSQLRKKPPLGGALVGATIGWIIGAFVVTRTGGPRVEAIVASAVPAALMGARFSFNPRVNGVQRADIEARSRSWIFLAPATFFISLGLLVPLARTIYLSLFTRFRDPETQQRVTEYAGLDNYRTIFGDSNNFSVSNWRNLFTSAPFEIGLLLVVVGFAVAIWLGRRSGNSFKGVSFVLPSLGVVMLAAAYFEFRFIRNADSEQALQVAQVDAGAGAAGWHWLYLALFLVAGAILLGLTFTGGSLVGTTSLTADLSGPHAAALAFGLFLMGMGIFGSLRGVVLNTLWWVLAVTAIATSLGLGIAALADRAKLENVAKSIIFMPMAISFVGAGIIWRFMYIARPFPNAQTGVMNFLWVKLGDLAQSDGPRLIVLLLLAGVMVGVGSLGYIGWRSGANGVAGGSLALFLMIGFLFWRLLDGRLGGTGVTVDGILVEDKNLLFLTKNLPYNNLWLMVVLIWIQAGFAMVIFSAAIKAVPSEFIEAAKVDGATDSDVFWRIIIPQIVPTIGVVVTTLIVTVLKVFDIVEVMTNGNFSTKVIANEMWFQAFTATRPGLGSALAVVLFLSVVPVVFFNVRRLERVEA